MVLATVQSSPPSILGEGGGETATGQGLLSLASLFSFFLFPLPLKHHLEFFVSFTGHAIYTSTSPPSPFMQYNPKHHATGLRSIPNHPSPRGAELSVLSGSWSEVKQKQAVASS